MEQRRGAGCRVRVYLPSHLLDHLSGTGSCIYEERTNVGRYVGGNQKRSKVQHSTVKHTSTFHDNIMSESGHKLQLWQFKSIISIRLAIEECG